MGCRGQCCERSSAAEAEDSRRHLPTEPGRDSAAYSDVDAGMATKNGDDNDFIHNWLVQTQRRPDWESRAVCHRNEKPTWRPLNLGGVQVCMPLEKSTHRKRRAGSFDSSLIPERARKARRPSGHPSGLSRKSPPLGSPNKAVDYLQHGLPSPSPASAVDEACPFEKRSRRKTRPDRYDTRKHETSEAPKEEEPKPRRTKHHGKSKLRPSREVVKNFTSDAILTDGRLTVKPLTAGLYANARSVPQNHSYNDMNFMTSSRRRSKVPKPSNSAHEKDRGWKEAERRELATFFAPESSVREAKHEEVADSLEKGRNIRPSSPTSVPSDAGVQSHDLVPEDHSCESFYSVQSSHEERPASTPGFGRVPCQEWPGRSSYENNLSQFSDTPDIHEGGPCTDDHYSTLERIKLSLYETGVFDGPEGGEAPTPRPLEVVEGTDLQRSFKLHSEEQRAARPEYCSKGTMANTSGSGVNEIEACLPAAAMDIRDKPSQVPPGPNGEHPMSTSRRPTEDQVVVDQAAKTGRPTTRASIAAKAYMPLYVHRGCQTDFPEPQPPRSRGVDASTQTGTNLLSGPTPRPLMVESLSSSPDPQRRQQNAAHLQNCFRPKPCRPNGTQRRETLAWATAPLRTVSYAGNGRKQGIELLGGARLPRQHHSTSGTRQCITIEPPQFTVYGAGDHLAQPIPRPFRGADGERGSQNGNLPEFIDRMERELAEREDFRARGVHGGEGQGHTFIPHAERRGPTYHCSEKNMEYQHTRVYPPQPWDATGMMEQSPFQNRLRIHGDGTESGSPLYWLEDHSQGSRYRHPGLQEDEPRHVFLEGGTEGLMIPPHKGFNEADWHENFANRERLPQRADPSEILARYGLGDEETEMDWPIEPFT